VTAGRRSLRESLLLLEELYEDGEIERAWKEVRRARRSYPEDLDLLEWEATISVELGRFSGALDLLDRVVSGSAPGEAADAGIHFERGICLDRLGRIEEADRAFSRAAELDPGEYPAPSRHSREEFDAIVRSALEEIPEDLGRYLENVVTAVMDYPSSPPLDAGVDPWILGLYVGIPRTERTQEARDHLDRIFIFKRNLEIGFPDPPSLLEEVRKTVIHEIAHHFGLGEGEMGEYA